MTSGPQNTNGTANGTNGATNGHGPLSTMPGPNHDYKVTLQDKVIASMYSSHSLRKNDEC